MGVSWENLCVCKIDCAILYLIDLCTHTILVNSIWLLTPILYSMSSIPRNGKVWGFNCVAYIPYVGGISNFNFKATHNMGCKKIGGMGTFLPILLLWEIIKSLTINKSLRCIMSNTCCTSYGRSINYKLFCI